MAEADAPPASAPAPSPPPAPSLEERERSVLTELAREVDAWVTFQGLRRQLRVHQQALARTLRRLEQAGLVSHAEKGYQLTDAGFAALRGEGARADRHVIPVVQALLPPHVAADAVAAQLSRRWFSGLRWYGVSEGPGETCLHWIAGRGKVTVRIGAGSVTLEVEDAGDETSFAATRPLLQALAEMYAPGAS